MRELLRPDGYVGRLKAKGYAVEEPQAPEASGAEAPEASRVPGGEGGSL